jgi:hypothetical protein
MRIASLTLLALFITSRVARTPTKSTDSVLSRSNAGMHINLITFIVSCPISAQGESA